MVFRKADTNDIPQLVELRKQQLLDEGMPAVRNIDDELTEYFSSSLRDETLVCWLAVYNGHVIATGGVCFYRLPPNFSNPTGWVAYITNMFTVREYRKQGIASRLLQLVIDEAVNQGYTLMRLHASSEGKPLYVKAGFSVSDGYMSMNRFP